jgi:hypothetical protein
VTVKGTLTNSQTATIGTYLLWGGVVTCSSSTDMKLVKRSELDEK